MAVVVYHHEFAQDAGSYDEAVQDAIAAYAGLLIRGGPSLGRPHADTLKGNHEHRNLKELRPTVGGVEWRVAYAFTTAQIGILLAAGAKNGIDEDLFYRNLIARAVRRLEEHEAGLAARSSAQRPTLQARGASKKKGRRK